MLHLDPDSVLVTTAAELQLRHLERDPDDNDRCGACGDPIPCPVEAAAALVCRAAGLWLEGDTLVEALEHPPQLIAVVPAPLDFPEPSPATDEPAKAADAVKADAVTAAAVKAAKNTPAKTTKGTRAKAAKGTAAADPKAAPVEPAQAPTEKNEPDKKEPDKASPVEAEPAQAAVS